MCAAYSDDDDDDDNNDDDDDKLTMNKVFSDSVCHCKLFSTYRTVVLGSSCIRRA